MGGAIYRFLRHSEGFLTNGRQRTEELLADLEIVPRKKIEYKGGDLV